MLSIQMMLMEIVARAKLFNPLESSMIRIICILLLHMMMN